MLPIDVVKVFCLRIVLNDVPSALFSLKYFPYPFSLGNGPKAPIYLKAPMLSKDVLKVISCMIVLKDVSSDLFSLITFLKQFP